LNWAKLESGYNHIRSIGRYLVANVRNPFSRLYSAWSDKSIIVDYHDHIHNKFSPGWKVFETKTPNLLVSRSAGQSERRNVTWQAFVSYVASNRGDNAMENHWKSQFRQCHICDVDYQFITHLEEGENEINFILEKLQVQNLTFVGNGFKHKETSTDEEKWKNIPTSTAVDIYRHYFADFVLLGYSPDMVESFISATDTAASPLSSDIIYKSREAVKAIRIKADEEQDDFFC